MHTMYGHEMELKSIKILKFKYFNTETHNTNFSSSRFGSFFYLQIMSKFIKLHQ